MRTIPEFYTVLSVDVLRTALEAAGIELPKTDTVAIRLVTRPSDGYIAFDATKAPLTQPFLPRWERVFEKTDGEPIERNGGKEIEVPVAGQYL